METKRPFLFLLPAATLSFPPAMDPGGDLGETIGPLQHQEGGPRIIAVRKLGSLGLFFFPDVIEFAGPLPLPATCGSAQSLCRTFHALKIPLVSLSVWLVFLTIGGTSVYSLNKYLLLIIGQSLGMELKTEKLPALREFTSQWKL